MALPRFGSAVQEVFVMPVLPGWRYPDLIDDDANLPENSHVPTDEAPLDAPGSPSAGGWATSYLLPPNLGRSSRPVRLAGRTRTDSRVARVGPTTPTRATTSLAASVDHTEARKTQTGLTGEQAAAALGISPRAADSLWACARAWLFERMHPDGR
jgi:hypothetical protein